ncbi:ABC transporter permease, partial [Pseudomonas sp. SDO528_S397]
KASMARLSKHSGLLQTIPMGFQNTHTLLSIVSFVMLALGVMSINAPHAVVEYIKVFNPMWWANEIMQLGVSNSMRVVCMAFFLMLMTFGLLLKYLIINPVWSRY